MYSYEWDKRTGGYRLTMQTGKFVASEVRPVFAEELTLLGLTARLTFDSDERKPLMWAKQNVYIYRSEEIAKLHKSHHGDPLDIEWKGTFSEEKGKKKLSPVNIESMLENNRNIMAGLVADTLKRIKEMYDAYAKESGAVYIGFSGGKDSVVLLDLCHKVLPLDVPVVFSDTDMELPDSYNVWKNIQNRYDGRPFLKVKAETNALENWRSFGPPSQALRWCCSVHKSTPAILALKERLGKQSIKTLAFVGVRGEESQRRVGYDDIGNGLKSQSQINAMPILSWSAHELWLYIFEHDLLLNEAYRKGLPRVGCLLCPMSSGRQNHLIRMNYPEAVKPFSEVVRETIDREFFSENDAEAFVHDGGWYARKSGVSLKQVIEAPGVERKRDRIICEFPLEVKSNLKEWLKAVGKIKGAELSLNEDGQRGLLQCVWLDGKMDRSMAKWLPYAVHKAIACIGCNSCEAECPTGALKIKKVAGSDQPRVSINQETCIHCMKCFSASDGCLRYFSKRYAGATTMNISGINKYMTFGMKPEWVEVLANEGADFRQTTALGNRMVPSAITWFRESGLIGDSTAITTTPLLDVGINRGFNDLLFWQLLWIRLANISPIVKWYVCSTDFGTEYSLKVIDDKLAQSVGSVSVRKGALQSLCQLIKNSPLGEGEDAPIEVGMKGRGVKNLTRRPTPIEPLVLLYGLYVIAEKAGRGTFTVRQMITADFEGDVVSPMVVFGLSPEEFKRQCMGLASLHPEFIQCSFTLGLDEVRVYPDTKSREDVATLF